MEKKHNFIYKKKQDSNILSFYHRQVFAFYAYLYERLFWYVSEDISSSIPINGYCV